jgi:hypothetical protein
LKRVSGLTEEEMEELDRIWKDIVEGKGVTLDIEDFLKEMKTW